MSVELDALRSDCIGKLNDPIPTPPTTIKITPYYTNPDQHRLDVSALDVASRMALDCSMYWWLVGGGEYRERAKEVLERWLVVPANADQETDLAICHKGFRLLLADKSTILYLPVTYLWLANTYIPACRRMATHPNNLGAWGLCGLIHAFHYLKDSDEVSELVYQFDAHLHKAIGFHNNLWREELRNNGYFHYAAFCLSAYSRTASLLDKHYGGEFTPVVNALVQQFHKDCLVPLAWVKRSILHRECPGILRKIQVLLFPSDTPIELPSTKPYSEQSGLFESCGIEWAESRPVFDVHAWGPYPRLWKGLV